MIKYASLVARLLMAGIFLFSGYGKLTDIEGTAGFIGSMGVPLPTVSALLAGVIEVGGAILLVAGFKVRWVTAVLFAYMIPVTAIFGSPVGAEGPAFRRAMIDFLKNLAIMSGLWMFVVHGGGETGLTARRKPNADIA